MLSNIVVADRALSVTPPRLKLSKKPGPTCKPIMNTNRISPNSCRNDSTLGVAVKPMWPAAMPANNTNVTPRDIPPILIFPNRTPTAMTLAYSRAMCATESLSVNKLISQSITCFSMTVQK